MTRVLQETAFLTTSTACTSERKPVSGLLGLLVSCSISACTFPVTPWMLWTLKAHLQNLPGLKRLRWVALSYVAYTLFFSFKGLTGTSTVSGLALTAQRVMAMLLKRVHHSRRDWKGLFSQVLLPVFFVIAAMGLGSIKSDLQHFPKIVLSPALYHVDEQYAFFRLDSLCCVTCLWFKSSPDFS